jgi:acetylornithine deacetylase/succinyl-diaminopimelate desuccinylase-like protein
MDSYSNAFSTHRLAVRRSPCGVFARILVLLALAPAVSLEAQETRYVAEIGDLAATTSVQDGFRIIEELEPQTLRDHIALTEIPAPPFQEEVRAEAFARLLTEAGADSVAVDEVGNVVAIRKGRTGGKTVVLGAHLDTVFPEGTDVTVRVRGDTLFAPGIGDDTRGLIVVLTVLRALERAGLETEADLVFLGSVGEEGLGDLRGVKHFFREGGPSVDAFIEIDGAGSGTIVNKGLGSVRYRVTFRGPGGHSWGAFGLVNPAHALGRAVERFATAADSLTHIGPRTSFNVGRMGGGTSINSIPYEAWMEVDMRSESPERLEMISDAFLDAVSAAVESENEMRRDGPPLEVDVDRIGIRPSGEIDPEAALVQRAMAVTRYFGEDPRLSRSSTNSNIPISLGIPAVTIGRGGAGGENHSPTEWWANIDGHRGIQRAFLLLLAEAGVPGGVP